jgi:hypothetical protein
MSTLIELVSEADHLRDLIGREEGSEEYAQALQIIEKRIAEKLDSVSIFLSRCDQEVSFWESQEKQAKAQKQKWAGIKDRVKELIRGAMTSQGVAEIKGEHTKFVLAKVKPRLDLDEDKLDPSWRMMVTEHVADKERIRKALESGEIIEGAQLIQGYALRSYP